MSHDGARAQQWNPRPQEIPDASGNMLTAALDLLAFGVSVVPLHSARAGQCTCNSANCRAPGKHPHISWEALIEHHPSPEDVRQWWHRWPSANLGIVTGEVSGLVVLDIDPRSGGDVALAELTATHGLLPSTVKAYTGGSGQHLYFRHPGRHIGCGPLVPGVDVKGDGGIVVCPPSRHVSGAPYRWAPGRRLGQFPLADLPAWLSMMVPHAHSRAHEEGVGEDPPQRTLAEQWEFSELWARFGVSLAEGDQYYLCPFHPDHRPSLHIDAEGCRFYCFGCGIGGGSGRLRQLAGEPGQSTRARQKTLAMPDQDHNDDQVTLAGGALVRAVGTSAFQDALLALSGGVRHYGGVGIETMAHLVPEPGNPADAGAVVVTIAGRAVGYLSRNDAVRLRPAIDEALVEAGVACCRATITGGWEREHGKLGYFGVTLEVPEGV